jgi:3-dehydroquinate synthase
MEAILVFNVKSYRSTYTVEFIEKGPIKIPNNGVVVIDQNLTDIYGDCLKDLVSIPAGMLEIYITPSEDVKTIDTSLKLISRLMESGFQRCDVIHAIGGGVIQDIVSFTSSILYRGVDWNFIPTTLLAQCDSCIGSKTSINHNGAKNILGGFHPPKEIKIYPEFLKTLPTADIKSGIGEMLHYFLLYQEFDMATSLVNDSELLKNIITYITKSLTIKREMIERDEFDKNERNLFNYGHTFGHAIEVLSNYEVNHGQAVTMGMEIANRLSLSKGLISRKRYEIIHSILEKNMPDYKIKDLDEYIKILHKDKKNVSDKLTCILLDLDLGLKVAVSYDEIRELLKKGV